MISEKNNFIDKQIIKKLTELNIYDVTVSRLGRGNKIGQLRKKEDTYYSLCPFHKDITPSFLVMPKIDGAMCLGCGIGFPNPVEFILKYSGKKELIRELGFEKLEIINYLLTPIENINLKNNEIFYLEDRLELLIDKANLETDSWQIENFAEKSLHFRAYMKKNLN